MYYYDIYKKKNPFLCRGPDGREGRRQCGDSQGRHSSSKVSRGIIRRH